MPSFRRLSAITLASALLLATSVGMANTAPEKKGLDSLRHGLGTASASALYHTHLFISATADGFKAKVFSEAQVRQALATSAKVTTALMDDLGRIKKSGIAPDDAAKLDALIEVCELVLKEARLISGMVRSSSPESERAFAEHHLMVRARLVKLLGL